MDSVTSLRILYYPAGRIASLVEPVVNTLLIFGHKSYLRISALSMGVGKVT